jgi:hypothetical protein
MRTSKGRAGLALVALAAIAAAPVPARAASRSAGADLGLGLTCTVSNFIYGPAKAMYALFGGAIGLVAFGLSAGDEEVAMKIIEPAWRGDYAITTGHLTGERELEFIGRRAKHRAARDTGGSDGGGGDW